MLGAAITLHSDLRGARFDGASVCADLRNADLRGASFRNADLSIRITGDVDPSDGTMNHNASGRTELGGADVSDVDFSGADLRGVDMSLVRGLTREQVDSAITNEKTKVPSRLPKRPRADRLDRPIGRH